MNETLKCTYCGGSSHNRDICPREALAPVRAEYERLLANVYRMNDCERYQREYTEQEKW